MLGQHHRLLIGRKEPISRHVSNLNAAPDKLSKGEAAILSPAEARDFNAGTTR
jgi:hypothetical protein